MSRQQNSWILAVSIIVSVVVSAVILSYTAIQIKGYERTVTVKGLSEQEHLADSVIWPIEFTETENDLLKLYEKLGAHSKAIKTFLLDNKVSNQEITIRPPTINDLYANNYNANKTDTVHYSANQTVTVHSTNVPLIQKIMESISDLGKNNIALSGSDYRNQPEYIFSKLNEIKPKMVEEATKNARAVALKFAEDSDSQLGKIKRASQGQFSIQSRDATSPHIKKVRVVSTVEYYLSD